MTKFTFFFCMSKFSLIYDERQYELQEVHGSIGDTHTSSLLSVYAQSSYKLDKN